MTIATVVVGSPSSETGLAVGTHARASRLNPGTMVAYRVAQLTICQVARLAWRLEAHDCERMPVGPVIVAANHESLLDPIIIGAAIWRPIRFLTKADLFVGPVAPLLRSLGGIPVVRGRGDREAVAAGARALEEGHAVGVFPQGTVLGGEARPWFRGAARLALATGAPVLPVCLVHTERALRPVRRTVGFPSIKALVGEPVAVAPGVATVAAARELTWEIRAAIEEMRRPYGSPRPAYPRR
jgi:1-acyl-sn-glycerol-3-phosphate acyltransferase